MLRSEILGCGIGGPQVAVPRLLFSHLTTEVGSMHHDGIDVGVVTGGVIESPAKFFETCGIGSLSSGHRATSRLGTGRP
jgi:hypothetical protein